MNQYEISNIGIVDLKEVYEYGVYKFGTQQAISYLEELEKVFELIASSPRIGVKRPEIDPRIHTFSHKSHLILYEITPNFVLINRILHGSRNLDKLFQ